MDQDLFRQTYRDVNQTFCAYEKSLLTNMCDCSQAQRFCIAEREGVRCASPAAQQQCLHWLDIVRNQARFTLKATEQRATIPHGKAMKVQVGGLRGLKVAMDCDHPAPRIIDDVFRTLEDAKKRFGEFDQFPMQTIIQQVAAYRGKRRAGRRKRD
jgi:hypothetical protein